MRVYLLIKGEIGLSLKLIDKIYKEFFYNNFSRNNIQVKDLGVNIWYLNNIGNFWDNYLGYDTNNDGIGETPYIISQDPLIEDRYPICNRKDINKPNITVISPNNYSEFSNVFNIEICVTDETVIVSKWYTINESEIFMIEDNKFELNYSFWISLGTGFYELKIYAVDSSGNIGNISLFFNKIFPPNSIIDDDDDDDKDNNINNNDSVLTLILIITIPIGILISLGRHLHKKRKI